MNLLFFDIDGTLVTRDTKVLPDSAKQAIRAARQAGNLAFLNTGRVLCNIEPYIREVGFDGYVCGCGTHVMLNDKTLFRQSIDHDQALQIADTIYKLNCDAVYESADKLFFDSRRVNLSATKDVQQIYRKAGQNVSRTQLDSDFYFDKFFGWHTKQSQFEELKQYLGQFFDVMDTGNNFFEVQPHGCSKASGIEKLMQHFNLPLDNVYVFGDSPNDESMFDLCTNVVCMGDTPDTYLMEKASFITKGVKEDGIAYALNTLGLTK